jgi:hypothetical protein
MYCASCRLEPLLDSVARQPGELLNGAGRKFVAHFHAPDIASNVHGDQLLLLLKNSANQWNTLVNLKLALRPSNGQFSIGDNI